MIEYLRPEIGSLFCRDRRRDQSSVHHLHQIVVRQILVCGFDYDRLLADLLERLVRLLQVFVIRGKGINVNLFSSKVREGGDRAEA